MLRQHLIDLLELKHAHHAIDPDEGKRLAAYALLDAEIQKDPKLAKKAAKHKDPLTDHFYIQLLSQERCDTLLFPLVKKYGELRRAWQVKADEIEKLVNDLCDELQPKPGPQQLRFKVCSSYTYNSQPNRERYARNDAIQAVWHLQDLGLAWAATKGKDYTVYALVEHPVDIVIAQKKLTPIREWVRRQWATGSNPRVTNPFLPHGFEEQEQIDYFGNDLRDPQAPRPPQVEFGTEPAPTDRTSSI